MEDDDIFPSFHVDIDGIVDILNEEGYERVLLQGPEGMKRGLMNLADLIEERTGSMVWIDGEPCYGSCDHAGEKAKLLAAEALIHLGHADIPSMEREDSVPIHFFHVTMRTDREILKRRLPVCIGGLPEGRTSLFTTIQHMDLLPLVKKELERYGRDVHIGEPGTREEFPGQVLGCSFHPAKDLPDDVTSLLFIGTGRFHPMGLCMESGKVVHTIDPVTGAIGAITGEDLEKILRGRFGHMNRARELLELDETVGVIVGFKPGQRRVSLSEEINCLLCRKEKRSKIVIMDHMDPMKLRSLGLKVAVSTSCPRIALDDSSRYSEEGVMLLTPVELRIVLGDLSWDEYRFDDEWE